MRDTFDEMFGVAMGIIRLLEKETDGPNHALATLAIVLARIVHEPAFNGDTDEMFADLRKLTGDLAPIMKQYIADHAEKV